jgi:uncharacterized protein involved in outer membrane biogenesis
LILIILFIVPIIFKKQIKTKVEQTINASVNATVKFEDYKLGFFRDFPNLTFSLNRLSVVGAREFQNDTLVALKSMDLVFNLSSLFKKTGYEVKSIIIDRAIVNAIVKKDGKANWDIMKDTSKAVATTPPAPYTAPTAAPTHSVAPAPYLSHPQPQPQPQPQSQPQSHPQSQPQSQPQSRSRSPLKILLKKVELLNSSILYVDENSAMKVYLKNVDFYLKGDMTTRESDLQITINAREFTFIMDDTKYINKAVLDSKIDILANLDKMNFTFRENYLAINDLKVNFSGNVAMPGKDIVTDIKFSTAQTSFKTLLSLIPAVYMKDYKDIKSSGEFKLSGSAKGIYSDADSTLPDVTFALSVSNGLISYPSLPEQIKNINIKSDIYVNGKALDKTIVNVDLFHMELAGSPFDMTLNLKTPISDPDFKASMVGRIDLAAFSKAVPMYSMSLSGIIDMSVKMAGKMSMIKKGQYGSFNASGKMGVKNMMIAMKGYPYVKINQAALEFTPAYLSITNSSMNVGGKSDFVLNGRIENYIPYVLSNKTIKGNLTLRSKFVDVSEIMSKMASPETTTAPVSSTAAVSTVKDPTADAAKSAPAKVTEAPAKVTEPPAKVTEAPAKVTEAPAKVTEAPAKVTNTPSSLTLIKVPQNIDFDIDALIDEFSYDNIKAQKVKGHLIIRNGILSIRDARMDILNGTIAMNADYDTRDTLKPVMKADFDMQNIGVKDAFNTFNTVKKLAPAAKGLDGKISVKMTYVSLLGRDMMPVTNSINGTGTIKSSEITLVESKTFDQMKEVLKLGDKYGKTFKDINISFKIADGRVFVSPFDVRTGNLKMNIGGDQGLDQTLNYIVKTEMPRSDLGSSVNSLINGVSSFASSLGIKVKPSDVLKVNVKVTGTFSKPLVTPIF